MQSPRGWTWPVRRLHLFLLVAAWASKQSEIGVGSLQVVTARLLGRRNTILNGGRKAAVAGAAGTGAPALLAPPPPPPRSPLSRAVLNRSRSATRIVSPEKPEHV